MTALTDVVAFISQADRNDLDRIVDHVKDRRRTLGNILAAAVRVGSEVTIGPISPKVLTGLTGTVKSISGKRCDIELDEASTRTLRFVPSRFHIPEGQEHYLLAGVPTVCALVSTE